MVVPLVAFVIFVLLGIWLDPRAPAHQLVAWIMGSAVAAFFAALFWAAISDPPSIDHTPPRPAKRRETLREVVVGTPFVAGILVYLGTIAVLYEAGFGALLEWGYWAFVGGAFVFAFVLGLFVRQTQVTVEGVRRDDERRRRARNGRPRDLDVLGSAYSADRRAWYRTARRWRPWLVVRRSTVAMVAAPLLALMTSLSFQSVGLPGVGRVFAGLLLVIGCGMLLVGLRSVFRDPLVLVGRIRFGLQGVAVGVASGGEETSKAAALSLMRYGFARTATVDIEAASRLRADGSLCSSPEWRGEHEIGLCRAVRRNAIQGEHCVLVCSGDGSALYLLSALAERLSRRRRGAYGRPQPSR